MSKSPSDLLDWTVTHAPEADELGPHPVAPASPGHRPALSPHTARRIAWITGSVIVGAVLGLGLFWLWNEYQTRSAIEQIIVLEESAAAERDIHYFRGLVADDSSEWTKTQVRWMIRGWSAPTPLAILQPVTGATRLAGLTHFAPNIVRADVTRPYTSPRGEIITFNLPQFYRYSPDGWKRIPPPEAYQGEMKSLHSPRLEVRYYMVDAARAKDLALLVEQTITQACATWREACPPEFHFTLSLTGEAWSPANSTTAHASASLPDEPLLFDIVLAPSLHHSVGDDLLRLPASTAVGYPADAASADFYRRAVALQVLMQTAAYLSLDQSGLDLSRNLYFYALVARLAARAGIEPASILDIRTTSLPFPPENLWNWNFDPRGSPEQRQALREALAIVNRLTTEQKQPSETESALFNALRGRLTPDPAAWLSRALSIPVEAAQAKLETEAANAFHVEVRPTAPRELALSCENGPAVFSFGDTGLTYFLTEQFSSSYLADWSPDGERLLLYLHDQPVVVDFASGEVSLVPAAMWSAVHWASDTAVASLQWPRDPGNHPILRILDVAHSDRRFPTFPDVQAYVLSPDKSTAAVVTVMPLNPQAVWTEISLMPALGGGMIPLDDSFAFPPRSDAVAAWSPDSRALAYARFASGEDFSIRVADAASGAIREIVSGDDFGRGEHATSAALAWSPAGDLIAFAAMSPDRNWSWVGMVNADGSDLKLLADQRSMFYQVGFSADGRYLAASFYDFTESQKLAVYDVQRGEQAAFLTDAWDFAWSPAGHALVFLTSKGVHLLAEPGDAAKPELLASGQCHRVIWNPAP